jgi:phosphate transport system substrate-binding protein
MTRDTHKRIVLGLALCGLAAGCRPAAPPPTRNLVLTGSSTMAPLVQDVGRRFEADHPGVRVGVQAVGTARGIGDVQQGLADIAMIARALQPEEGGLHAFVIARDGVCLVVPRSSPVTTLTETQVVGILTHVISNWKQVGGPDTPITFVGEPEARSLAQPLLDHLKLRAAQVRPDIPAGDGEQILKAVAERPDAIGYAPLGLAAEEASALRLRLLPCGGVPATPANVANGTYPVIRPLLLVTREPPQGLAKEFIDFARSPAIRELLDKYHESPPGE